MPCTASATNDRHGGTQSVRHIACSSCATVGASISMANGRRRVNTRSISASSCTAFSEWPPPLEEVVVHAQRVVVEHLAPQREQLHGQQALRVGDLAPVCAAESAALGGGSALTSTLWLAVSGSARNANNADGTMYAGNELLQMSAQGLNIEGRPFRRAHHIGHQLLRAPGVWLCGHRALRDRRVPRQYRFDLAELDAEAPHLDLEVVASQVHQAAVGEPSRQITGAIQARTGRSENGSGTKRSAVSSGRLR